MGKIFGKDDLICIRYFHTFSARLRPEYSGLRRAMYPEPACRQAGGQKLQHLSMMPGKDIPPKHTNPIM